jgi:hypothetical protein
MLFVGCSFSENFENPHAMNPVRAEMRENEDASSKA